MFFEFSMLFVALLFIPPSASTTKCSLTKYQYDTKPSCESSCLTTNGASEPKKCSKDDDGCFVCDCRFKDANSCEKQKNDTGGSFKCVVVRQTRCLVACYNDDKCAGECGDEEECVPGPTSNRDSSSCDVSCHQTNCFVCDKPEGGYMLYIYIGLGVLALILIIVIILLICSCLECLCFGPK